MFQERYSLETPEHVPVEFEVAGPMARFAAAIYDGLVLFIGLAVVSLVFVLVAIVVPGLLAKDVVLGALAVACGVALLGYFPLFECMRGGQTPGKAALGIRVMRRDMAPLDFGSAAIRGILRIVDALPGLPFPLVGLVAMTASDRSLRLGDLAAGTWVVRVPGDPPVVDGFLFSVGSSPAPRARFPRPALGPALPAGEGRLTSGEFRLAADFLERAPTLDPARRRTAAASIADPILRRLGEQRLDAERFLREEAAKGSVGKSLL